jgi:hypothetical protein
MDCLEAAKKLPRSAALLASLGGLLLTLCLLASTAHAAFEQVDHFAETKLNKRTTGTAVNYTGAGGVPAGTLYMTAIGKPSTGTAAVLMYTPQGEFFRAFGWGVVDSKEEFQTCGPVGDPDFDPCRPGAEETGGLGIGGEGLGQLRSPWGVAIDQSTGAVYVINAGRSEDVVQIFNAKGTEPLGGFGKPASSASTNIESEPATIHQRIDSTLGSGIAADSNGKVYIVDADRAESPLPHVGRLMVFEPETPGDYSSYAYVSRGADIDTPPEYGPQQPAVDADDNVYISSEGGIIKYGAGTDTPVCTFTLPAFGLESMTVNALTGEPFYFSAKNKKIHRLACNSGGQFVETEVITPTEPKPEFVPALAFDPAVSFDLTRPPGILYGMLNEKEVPGDDSIGVGYIFAEKEAAPPAISKELASDIGTSSAVLGAEVNPNGLKTHYKFELISDSAFQANEPGDRFAGAIELPPGGNDVASGLDPIAVGVTAAPLQPGTKYHFRVVADHCPGNLEPFCATFGEGATFTTFVPSSGLPDNRAWELVSPVQKQSGQVYPSYPFVFTRSCMECKPGIIATRFPIFSSAGGDRVVYEGDPFSFTEGSSNNNEYLSERTATGWKTTALSPVLQGSGGGQGHVAVSRDLSQGAILQEAPSLTATAPPNMTNLYRQATAQPLSLAEVLSQSPPNSGSQFGIQYRGGTPDLTHLVFSANDALTAETPFAPAATYEFGKTNLYEAVDGEIRLVSVLPGNAESVRGATLGSSPLDAISDDGSRIFWSDPSGQVYLRVDGEFTVEIPVAGNFLTASADGKRVLLSSGQLYVVDQETVVDLTDGQGGFLGLAGKSKDLSHIYFVDTHVLSAEPNDQGDSAQEGAKNLYAWSEGEVTFVAGVDNDFIWKANPVERTAEASPNGRWLAFNSDDPLTGVDPTGLCGGNASVGEFVPGPCLQVFLYDSQSGELRCASCSPTEEAPLGNSRVIRQFQARDSFPQPRYLTDSGRLYFDSPNRLVASDTNGLAEDVYQFEPGGAGDCGDEEGCVSLLSAGAEAEDSNLLAVDATGKNVFFTTRDQLSPLDSDELIDLYVAREDGGIAAESETPPSECQGEACQPPVFVPNDPTPGSSTLEGSGNLEEKRAKPKKHKKKHHKKKKHRKKKHHKKSGKKSRASHNRGGAK